MHRLFAFLALATSTTASCPPTPPSSFSLPQWTTQWEGTQGNQDGGIQFIDVSGDSLPDLVFGYSNAISPPLNCIYINTQCGWVLQANYTGPDNSCLPASSIYMRGIDISFAGLTVKQFALDVAEQFGLVSRAAVVVRLAANGHEQGLNRRMDDIAATSSGFTVHVGGEIFSFNRGYYL